MKLDPKQHPWLRSKSVERIFDALPESSSRFVGGCVRNAIIGAPLADYDIATTVPPTEVIQAMKHAKIAVHETGLSHGTVTAVANHTVYEITTLRRDVSTDGRRASVAFTTDWDEDAARRDFTMNALYADRDGQVFDPTGQGIEDAISRRIRFVGSASKRIEEDFLRILRFFRFHAWYGEASAMDKDGLSACRELKDGLKTLSSERVWAEIKKLLSAPAPHRTVNVMLINGILETLLPEASNSEGLQRVIEIERELGLEADPYLRLMAMAARDEFAIAGLCRRLKMSNAEKARLIRWAGDMAALAPGISDKDLKAELYVSGKQVALDRAVLRSAGADDPIVRQGWLSVYETAKNWEWPVFPVTGKDLITAGIPSGTRLGKALAALEALWIRSGFTADKERLMVALTLIRQNQ